LESTWVKSVKPAGPAMQAGYVPAPIVRRALAFLIDFIVIMAAVYASEVFLGRQHCELRRDVMPTGGSQASYMCYLGTMASNEVLAAVYSAAYCVATWRLLSATPGQRIFNMHVYAQEASRPLPLLRCLVRWAALYGWLVPALVAANGPLATVSELVLFAWLLTMLRTAYTSRFRQGWHDRLARSVVVCRGTFWAGRRRFAQDDQGIAAEEELRAKYGRPDADGVRRH
jgi:uncharacterized RDD family membrane protein YckC